MLNKKALAASVSAPPAIYPEDVFSTYLYTGNGSTQTITNGIDLAGEGGMVWNKSRSSAQSHGFWDTQRGATKYLRSDSTGAEATYSGLTSFLSSGFSLGSGGEWNQSGVNYASWTFRKQPKFFDVVTYTGNGTSGRAVAHNLGATPGMIIVKRTDSTGSWFVYHRSLGATKYVLLDTSDAENTFTGIWNDTAPTSTVFTVGNNAQVNASGGTYVAYLFAHDAGGFGAAGTDNVISCGSFVTGSGSVNLGYEPQYVLYKQASGTGSWQVLDTMRGWNSSTTAQALYPNLASAEEAVGANMAINATGFAVPNNPSGATFIYMAIRRPMKVPTTGTEVFSPIQAAGSTGTKLTTNFPVDLQIWALPGDGGSSKVATDRLRGVSTNATTGGVSLYTDLTNAENNASNATRFFDNTGYTIPGNFLGSGYNAIYWNFRRASGFFDVVCYTGTGATATTQAHNLGVAPELMIVKSRSNAVNWAVYSSALGGTQYLNLNTTGAADTFYTLWNDTNPTSSVFTVGPSAATGASGYTYVAYLFATCPGVSKVFSYTGNGSSQTINCAFTAGARLVLIKRTDSTGDWYIWDSSRGIVSGNDPRLSLNTTAAEVTSDDTIDPDSSGFVVNQVAATNVNVSSATYIGIAIS